MTVVTVREQGERRYITLPRAVADSMQLFRGTMFRLEIKSKSKIVLHKI